MDDNKPKDPLLTNKLYDYLKFFAQILLPAAGTLYFSLAGLWSFPEPEKVVATIVAVDTFLGVFLTFSTLKYKASDAPYDGTIHVTENPDGVKQASLVLKNYADPAAVVNQESVTFKVSDLPEPDPGNQG